MRKVIYLILFLVFSSGFVWAQEATISGQVTTLGGEPLEDAVVYVEDLNQKAHTDADGYYELSLPSRLSYRHRLQRRE